MRICRGPRPGSDDVSGHVSGSGLRGLTERLAAAGGTLTSGPGPGGGFRLSAELPVQS
ncbi:hypothetical protein ACWGI0_33465 [Streptomyces sp. NPDC054802]